LFHGWEAKMDKFMDKFMDEFIHSENVARYKKLIAETNDDVQRQILLGLLKEERAKEPPLNVGRLPL
jgi:hypothetical protein